MCYYIEIDIMLGRRFRIEFRSELFFKHTDTRMSSNLQ